MWRSSLASLPPCLLTPGLGRRQCESGEVRTTQVLSPPSTLFGGKRALRVRQLLKPRQERCSRSRRGGLGVVARVHGVRRDPRSESPLTWTQLATRHRSPPTLA